MSYFKKNNLMGSSGHSTVEILVAFAVCSLCLAGVAALTFGNQSVSVDTERNAKATGIARQAMEVLEAKINSNFDTAVSGQCLDVNGNAILENGYTCQILTQNVSSDIKTIVSRVSWQTDNRTQKVELTSTIANSGQILATGGDGPQGTTPGSNNNEPGSGYGPNSYFNSNSTCPTVSYTSPGVSLPGGSVANSFELWGNYAFIGVKPSVASNPDFYVINTSNLESPTILTSLVTGGLGVNAVDVVTIDGTTYALLATQDPMGQFKVVNISQPNNPVLVNAATLGLPGNSSMATAIHFFKNLTTGRAYVYLGTDNNSSAEFYIIDITSLTNPVITGTFEVGAKVNAIYVRNGFAYVAAGSSSSQILALDIRGATPQLYDHFTDAGSVGSQSLYFFGGTLFVGSAPGPAGSGVAPVGVFTLAVSNGNLSMLTKRPFNAITYSITASGNYAYLAVGNSMRVMDISDPTNLPNPCYIKNFTAAVSDISYANNYIFVTLKSTDGFVILKMQ